MALTTTTLNAIIGLILVGVVISTGFFIYSSFVDSFHKSQVLAGFDSFIKPIRDVCNGAEFGFNSDLSLPVSNDYTYGIFQTRLKNYQPGMPIVMRKCVDSYCVCAFRMKKQDYDFWDTNWHSSSDDWIVNLLGFSDLMVSDNKFNPAPLWFFERGGKNIFLPLTVRIVKMMIVRVVVNLLSKIAVDHIATTLACSSVSGGTASAACVVAEKVAIYALRGGTINAIMSIWEQTTQPLLLVNYPLFLMSTDDPHYLYWNSDVSCDYNNPDYCTNTVYFKHGIEKNILSLDDAEAVGASFLEGALEGVWDGLLASFGSGSVSSVNLPSTVSKKLSKTAVKQALKSLAKKAAVSSLKGSLRTGRTLTGLQTSEWSGVQSLDFQVSSQIRPIGFVKSLLGIRRLISLDGFISASTSSLDKRFEYSFDDSLNTFNGFDVIDCVSISDLGPLCNDDTKLLIDYGSDVFVSYRVTDPINFPAKSVFCGFNGNSNSYDINLITFITNPVFDALDITNEDIRSFVNYLINLFIGDWLLAGATSMKGLFMECVNVNYDPTLRSEYFQYWVMDEDKSGLFGYNGQIPAINAYLVNGDESNCVNQVYDDWSDCVNNYYSHIGSPNNAYNVGIPYSATVFLDVVCPTSNGVDCDYTANWSYNITCYDVYKSKEISCKNGIHLVPLGVIE